MNLQVLIVDDEAAARAYLRRLLESEPDIQVVGECTNGEEAVSWLRRHSADLVFLDIQMPGLDGFQVLRETDPANRPPVVLVTAYDEFALEAFSVQAWDYLLKPYDQDRLRETLDRVRARVVREGGHDPAALLSQFIERLGDTPEILERITVRKGSTRIAIRTADIDWLEAQSNYVRLHVGADSYLARTSLTQLETKLDPKAFVRIHRSTIVNLDRIQKLEPVGHGDLKVTLTNGRQLNLSRRYRANFERVVENLA